MEYYLGVRNWGPRLRLGLGVRVRVRNLGVRSID
jgi:hypothetical protein